MKHIEDKVNLLIQNHFPQFYNEDGKTLVEFVKEYYKWMESSNNTLYYSRNLLEFRDIDTTVDEFLIYFKNKYLAESPVYYERTRSNVKNASDFYRSKGTEQGTKTFFKEVFGLQDVDIYFPGKDVIKASDGEWYVPIYLEVSVSEKTSSFVGKQITGSRSRATAFVESVSRKSVRGKHFDVLILTNVKGRFLLNDVVTVDGELAGCPSVIGSLTKVQIDSSGRGFAVGDIVDIVSPSLGKQGKLRVDSVVDSTGKVTFTLLDGGSGYRLITNPIVADKTILVTNKTSSDPNIKDFNLDEIIIQPLANISFYNSNVFFSAGSLLTGSNTTADVATGRVVSGSQVQISGTATATSTSNTVIGIGSDFRNQIANGEYIRFSSCTSIFQVHTTTNATHLILKTYGPDVTDNSVTISNGSVLLVVTSGNFSNASSIKNTTAIIGSYTDRTATGVLMGVNSTAIGLTSVSNTFVTSNYNFVYGQTSNVYANLVTVGTGTGADFSVGSLTDEETVFINEDLLNSNNYISNTILSGTVSSNDTSTQVNGVGTSFTTDLYRGSYIKFSTNNLIYQVNSVSNDTVLMLTTNGPVTSGDTLTVRPGPYKTLPINAFKYGFPKLQSANVDTILNLVLTRDTYTIGTIASLSGINPGTGYNINPFVLVRDVGISAFDRRDIHVEYENLVGGFITGEEITQELSRPSYTLIISGSNVKFTTAETVTQQINSTSNNYGEVVSSNTTQTLIYTGGNFVNSALSANLSGTVTSNATSSQVNGTATLFNSELLADDYIKFSGNNLLFQVNNIVNNTVLFLKTNSAILTATNITLAKASNVAVGLSSGKYFYVNTAISDTVLSLSRGTVLETGPGYVNVKRKTFNQTFTDSIPITGSISGATADVVSATQIEDSELMGNNAVVRSSAGVVNGAIDVATVIDSGYAYYDGEPVTIVKTGSPYVATGFANVINEGVGEGYFKSSRGFLNSDKYIHDGKFYQSYSYQIRSSIPLNVYGDTLKKVCHIAGTELFGNLIKTSDIDVEITSVGLQIET